MLPYVVFKGRKNVWSYILPMYPDIVFKGREMPDRTFYPWIPPYIVFKGKENAWSCILSLHPYVVSKGRENVRNSASQRCAPGPLPLRASIWDSLGSAQILKLSFHSPNGSVTQLHLAKRLCWVLASLWVLGSRWRSLCATKYLSNYPIINLP